MKTLSRKKESGFPFAVVSKLAGAERGIHSAETLEGAAE